MVWFNIGATTVLFPETTVNTSTIFLVAIGGGGVHSLPVSFHIVGLYVYVHGYESMVSLVSRRYMRGENGTESLVVCLSEYVTLRSVFTLLIAV